MEIELETIIKLPDALEEILSLDGFIIFISGPKGWGKTNLAMFLLEYCQTHAFRKVFATNINTECYFIDTITNLPDFKQWLHRKGKKGYALDELGQHAPRLRFMRSQNVEIMQIVQLTRHYDCGLIGIAPNMKYVDTNFLNTDILDAHIIKRSRGGTVARVIDLYHHDEYFLHSLPETSIKYNSKDDAIFTMEKIKKLSELALCCQVAKLYARTESYKVCQNQFQMKPEQVRRQIIKHLKHAPTHDSQTTERS